MEVFWQKGFAATSMQDLVDAMGINRGSLYATFQDKHQLFLEALTYYAETITQPAVSALEAPTASKQAIIDHFYRVAQEAVTQTGGCGCLITNSMVELAPHNPQVRHLLKQILERLEDAFHAALLRAQEHQEIPADMNLRAMARYLTSSMQGLRVLAKADPEATAIQDVVATILSGLD